MTMFPEKPPVPRTTLDLPMIPDAKMLNPAAESFDPVDRPRHYASGTIECIDAIESALGRDGFVAFLRGQVMKYTWRVGAKGDALEDARKAAWYQARLVKTLSA